MADDLDAEGVGPTRHGRRARALAIGIALLCAAGGGTYVYARLDHGTGGDTGKPIAGGAQAQAAGTVRVAAARAERQDVPVEVTGLGTVQPLNSVTVKPRIGGQIVEIAFKEGQSVKAGDVLARLDPRPFQAPLQQAKATLAKDTAQLGGIAEDLKRTTSLARNGWATGQALDSQKAQHAGLAATIQSDEAAIANAQLQLDYATVTSPIDGVVGIRMIDTGNVIATGDPGIVVVNQLDPISSIFTVPAETVADWPVGSPAGVIPVTALSADTTKVLASGSLALVDNKIDPATATIKLKATFPNPSGVLKPGQFVNVRLRSEMLRDVVAVPAGAVQGAASGAFAYLVGADGTLAQRKITVSRTVGGTAVIAAGLSAGDVVVTSGQYGLKAGMKVVPDIAAAADRVASLAQASE